MQWNPLLYLFQYPTLDVDRLEYQRGVDACEIFNFSFSSFGVKPFDISLLAFFKARRYVDQDETHHL